MTRSQFSDISEVRILNEGSSLFIAISCGGRDLDFYGRGRMWYCRVEAGAIGLRVMRSAERDREERLPMENPGFFCRAEGGEP